MLWMGNDKGSGHSEAKREAGDFWSQMWAPKCVHGVRVIIKSRQLWVMQGEDGPLGSSDREYTLVPLKMGQHGGEMDNHTQKEN